MFERITILGVGLIGASFALAARKGGLCREITGFGRSRETLERAKKKGIIDAFSDDPASACSKADLVLLATPVGTFSDIARSIAPSLKKGCLITDAGSVKGSLVRELEKAMPAGVSYVGAHPIAGSDRSGLDFARTDLYENALCIVTPTERSSEDAVCAVRRIWEAIGCSVVTMGPEQHDRIYAAVSHLPHIIAYALMNSVAEIDASALHYSGQGFKDTTRIAASSQEIWRDICLLNRENLIEMISVFQTKLDAIGQYLRASDAASLEREFGQARTLREGIGQN